MLKAVTTNHVARRTQVVFKAFSTLPEYPGYLTIVTTMAASVDVLHTWAQKEMEVHIHDFTYMYKGSMWLEVGLHLL